MGLLNSKLIGTKTPLVDQGYLVPKSIQLDEINCDFKKVKNLIQKGLLTPFYEGMNESNKDSNGLNYEIECPICFLYFPSSLNKTTCCNKSICTECLLQLKLKPNDTLPCPFCVQVDLSILYIPPIWSKFYLKFKKERPELFNKINETEIRRWIINSNDPNIISCVSLRNKLEIKRPILGLRSSFRGFTRRRRLRLEQPLDPLDVSNNEILNDQVRYIIGDENISNISDLDYLNQMLESEAIRLSLMDLTQNSNSV